jgi:hypothetical protein
MTSILDSESITVFYNSREENLNVEIPPHFKVISYGSTVDGLSYYAHHVEFETSGNLMIMLKILDIIFTSLKIDNKVSEFIIAIN